MHILDRVPDAVYVGRRNIAHGLLQSPFANPFRLPSRPSASERAACLMRYEAHLTKSRHLIRLLPMLRGKPLACWCRHDGEPATPYNACHADILLRWLDENSDEDLRLLLEGD